MNRQEHSGNELGYFGVYDADGEPVGTPREIMILGPSWRGKEGETLLHMAAGRGRLPWIRELLDRGWDPNDQEFRFGANVLQTLVMSFSSFKSPEDAEKAVRLLLKHGASMEMRDDSGNTALFYADRHPRAVRLLLDLGADPNAVGDVDSTPLFLAAQADNAEVVRMLVDAGANVHHRNQAGTVLCTAALCKPAMVKLLLELGVDPTAKNYEGEDPLTIAIEAGFVESAAVLRAHFARQN